MKKMSRGRALRHLLLLFLLFAGQVATTKELSKDARAAAKWVKKARSAKPKVTHLNFYLHENITSDHPTALPIAESSITNKLATGFGKLFMFEDSLTIESSTNSTIIGYARGLFGSASQTEIGLVMALNFVFTDGEFKGSTLVLAGYNDALVSPREVPISGGTGVFRLARGVATLNTLFLNTTSFDSIIEYNIAVMHY